MADNDVRIKVSLDGDKLVIDGLDGIGKSAEKTDSKLGSFVGKGLKGAGVALAGFATAAVAGATALSIGVVKAYADYEQNVGGIETLFGDSADRMMEYASNAYFTSGLSANAYMEQATGFAAALTGSLAEGADAAKAADDIMVAMSDNANKMGTDMESIQNAYNGFSKQNFTMLDNLKLGYGGTQAEMQRLLDDAEKLPGALGQEFDLNNFADVSKAIQLIQEDMGIAGTTALEAEETISGALGMLSASYENLLTGLGDADADVGQLASNVISSFELVVTNIAPVIQNIGDHLATLGPQMGSMMESLISAVVTAIPGLISAGSGMIEGLVQGISSSLPSLITAAVPAIVGLVEMIASQLPLFIDSGMKAVIALGEGLVQAIPTLLPTLAFMITGIAEGIISNLPALLDVALQLILALADGILEAIPVLIEYLPELIYSIVNFIVGAIPQLMDAGLQLFLSLVEALPEIIAGIVEAIPLIITGILDAVLGSIPQLIEGGIELLMGLIGALPQIIVGIVKAIPQIIGGILKAVIGAIPQLVSAGFNLLTSLVKNIGSIASTIAGKIPQIITGIVNKVKNGVSQMASAGGDLLRGLWNGISGVAGWLYNKVMGWASGLLDGVKSFFGIASPSKIFKDEIGAMLSEGVGIGIEVNADKAIKPMEDLSHQMVDKAHDIQSLAVSSAVDVTHTTLAPPHMASMQAIPTPQYASTSSVTEITGPLVHVGHMEVRNDQDIRKLSTQLRTDMNRELRAQGVLS